MNTFFGNLRLRNKIILLVSMPLIAFAVLAISELVKLRSTQHAHQQFGKLAELSLGAGALVHELQKERGTSAGYLSSRGTAFKDRLPKQKMLTDARLESFRLAVQSESLDVLDPEALRAVKQVVAGLDVISDLRHNVQALQINVGEAVRAYTAVNSALLNLGDRLAHFSPDGLISNARAAYSALLQSKERAGLERAVLSSIFAADVVTSAGLAKLVELVNTQEVYLSIFETAATAEQQAFYDQRAQAAAFDDVARLRAVVLDGTRQSAFGIVPTSWFDTITKKINLLKEVEDKLGADMLALSTKTLGHARQDLWQLMALIVVAFVLSALLIIYVTRKIVNSISEALLIAHAMAGGSLDSVVPVAGTDEAGLLLGALDSTQVKLRQIIASSQRTAESVLSDSSGVLEGSIQLNERSELQAASLLKTGSSLEQISSRIKHNAESANEADSLAVTSRGQAEAGVETVESAIVAMSDISAASERIEAILRTIDDIAFQTNLLALNAAVEAARAGEQGRGFAIVASEVRGLAGRSAEAAREIKMLIHDSLGKVDAGVNLVNRSGQTLGEIVDSIRRVSDLVSGIASASREQSEGLVEIQGAMSELDNITRQNLELVTKTSASSESTRVQAQELTANLAYFRTGPTAR